MRPPIIVGRNLKGEDRMADDELREAALEYHRSRPPGKIQVMPTKPLVNQRDLALAYSPGVAEACRLIEQDPLEASNMTSRGNLVAVITNGTAVLGLGNIGPLASKPVMEGKGVLFKKFAGIDVFDIEINESDPDKLVDIIASLEPTFGGINLEDIKSPECFEVERKLRDRVSIPVFHDDQHGTAIIAAAATINGLKLLDKSISSVKLVVSGAGAAAIACIDLLIHLGLLPEHIVVCDTRGVIHAGREDLPPHKARFARDTAARTLADAMRGADIFLGLSVPGVVSQEMVASMAPRPLILALANPVPEILPDQVHAARDDAIVATGRSDFPNQVNNALCFPYIFRGALDVGATTINEAMKLACVEAIAALAEQEVAEEAMAAYGGQQHRFGPEYLIPKPFDPRLIAEIAPAVARAAMESGVATRPIQDMPAYEHQLHQFIYQTGMLMRPIMDAARADVRRVVYSEGEEERVLRAVQVLVDDGLVSPVLIGRPDVVQMRIERLGLRLKIGADFELVNPQSDPRYREYWTMYHERMERRGITPDVAREIVRTNTSVIAALMLMRGEVDAMICGVVGRYEDHLRVVSDLIEKRPGIQGLAAMNMVILPEGTFSFVDTYVNPEPTAEQICDATLMAAEVLAHFGLQPRVALVSHSSFGSADDEPTRRLRSALALLRERAPELEVDGEMQMDAALSPARREHIFPNSTLSGQANLLVFPSLDAANSSFNIIRILGKAVSVGPLLLGPTQPAHIITPTLSVRGIVNVSALAAVEAQVRGKDAG